MINELYNLSEAMSGANIKPGHWHLKYNPLFASSSKSPCFRVVLSNGKVQEISPVEKELGSYLRKYGSNQGSFPCMNFTPLYRVTDKAVKKALLNLCPEMLSSAKLEEIKGWRTENNWTPKFQRKYLCCMKKVPDELSALVPEFEPLQILIEEIRFFLDPAVLHQALEETALAMLAERKNVSLARTVLFQLGNPDKKAEDDSNEKIVVCLETPRLIQMGIPAVGCRFVDGLNKALLSAKEAKILEKKERDTDAFGHSFFPTNERMPMVRLAAGFDVTLRTMFELERSQMRYGRIGSASYPLSPELRMTLQSSLAWLGSAEQKGKTWINTDTRETLFAYPSHLPEASASYVNSFAPVEGKDGSSSFSGSEGLFSACAKGLISELRHGKEVGTDPNADRLQVFILKKVETGRSKIVYSRQTDARELEILCEAWTVGCGNLPQFPFGQPRVIFPLDAADVLNRFWNQDGQQAKISFKPVPRYHGVELMLEPALPLSADLHILAGQTAALGTYFGSRSARKNPRRQTFSNAKDLLALIGMLLYRAGIRKETYMENLPYLFGQLLKVSDELHALYCEVVRDGELPQQLAGSGMYTSALETPVRTLNLLGLRMNPYIAWAKFYQTKGISEKGKESWRAGWYLSLYERIATKLQEVWQPEKRFGDAEKAQLFIGYLAKFPKGMRLDEPAGESDENNREDIKEE